jgi:hypothetical protein
MSERKNRPVLIDWEQLEKAKGSLLTEEDAMAVAIAADAMACGRTVAETVDNIKRYGGEVSKGVKRRLGLEPPARLVIPGPPESIRDN